MNTKEVIVRIAPSPTGLFHVGTARTALFNYFFAKQHGGKFLVRIEDTDKERSKKEFEDNILESLKWLGLSYDDELVRQSERTELYKKYLKQLIAEGKGYEAEESEKGDGKVIRLKNANKKVKFNDLILGDIEFDTTELGDFIIAKNDESPLYHLAVVIDDAEMNITHVIRGQDHISNTPRQILIQEALGFSRPEYAHIPLILAADKSKLSKRHGAVSLKEFQEKGYLKEAFINFLAFIGWNPGGEREVYSMEELIKEFDLGKVQKGGAVFNLEKLDWLNKQYIAAMKPEEFASYVEKEIVPLQSLQNFSEKVLQKVLSLIHERISTLEELKKMIAEGEYDYFFKTPEVDVEKLVWKKSSKEAAKKHLTETLGLLESVEDWNLDGIKKAIWDYAEKEGKGEVLWPLRYALSGREKSPDPFVIAEAIGKEATLQRVKQAEQLL